MEQIKKNFLNLIKEYREYRTDLPITKKKKKSKGNIFNLLMKEIPILMTIGAGVYILIYVMSKI
jgi:hypothetical protein